MTNRSRWVVIAAGILMGFAVAPSAIRRTQAAQVSARVRAAVGVPVESVTVQRDVRVIRVFPKAVPEWTLAQYRALERSLEAPAQPWRAVVVPPLPPRVHIRFGTDAVTSAVPVVADAELAMWAVQRSGAARVVIEGLAGIVQDSATRALARMRAEQVKAVFDGMALDVTVREANADTLRALDREGGNARLHGVDLLVDRGRRTP